MSATSTSKVMCSFPLNFAQNAMLCTHHHGRCGGADELMSRRAPRPRYGPKQKMIILQEGNHRAQGTCGHLPSRRAVATAQCTHAPVTMHYNTCGRCRDALPGRYLCCSSEDKCNARPSAQDGGGHQSRRAGGASLCRGTPALHRAMLGRQFSCNVKSKVIIE